MRPDQESQSADSIDESRLADFERDSRRCGLRLFVGREEEGHLLEMTGNVGLGGFYVEATGARPLRPGDHLRIQFHLPELNILISTRGRVLSAEQDGERISARGTFIDLSDPDRESLARWLEMGCPL